jgi:hypothetical protein
MRIQRGLVRAALALALAAGGCAGTNDPIADAEHADAAEIRAIAEAAYIYGFPMLGNYKAMYQFSVDEKSGQFRAPFNQISSSARVATPKDTAVVTPNSDTPYSTVELDLRAEPIVLCVPAVDPKRYYSVQLIDMYTQNYGYVGSRATGSKAGCYLVAGPRWSGAETPAGIAKVFRCETDFSLAIYRTQLFSPADIANVKKVQAGYKLQTLSKFAKKPAPPALPPPAFPAWKEEAFKAEFPAYLDFLLQFAPAMPEETALRARFGRIGIGPGRKFDFKELSLEQKLEVGKGIESGFAKIEARRAELGSDVNYWRIGAAGGDRAFYAGDYTKRAAIALAGIFANDAEEAAYPMTFSDAAGEKLDGSAHAYTLTFAAGELPPVNAFWSVTMYDGKTQLLVANPLDRYLINSPMLPKLKKNADGSLTLRIQSKSPGKALESNWLPAPAGPIYLVMRLYWPKLEPPSILPPGKGTWKPPGVVASK